MTKLASRVLRIGLIVSLLLLVTVTSETSAIPASSDTDLEGVRIAIWDSDGALENSVVALDYMFNWMNATVIFTNSSHIFDGGLDNVDILCFPGGDTGRYTGVLGRSGMDIIRDFVSTGGSYWGICGGSLFGTRLRLELFNGSYIGPVAGSNYYMMNMSVNRDSTGPDLSEEPETYSLLYWSSCYFRADDMTGIIPIVTYPSNGEAAMIAFHYDYGTVFLSSPHPEYEENDDRDGTSDFDNLDDPDSEWGLLLKVTRWLVDASPEPTVTETTTGTTTNTTNLETPLDLMMMITLLGGSGVVIVVMVVLLKRR